MRKRASASFVLSLVLLGSSAFCQSPRVHSPLRIVRNPVSAPPVQFAVRELVKYLRLMGNPPPTVLEGPQVGDIYVGMIPLDASSEQRRAIESRVHDNPDGFVICTLGDALLIYGGSPRADL